MIGSVFGEYVIVSCVINQSDYGSKIIFSITALYVSYLLYGAIAIIKDGRFCIRNIKIKSNKIVIIDSLHRTNNLSEEEIISISYLDMPWFFPKPHFYKTGKKGLTIKISDGRFFRVSPHMERIDKLKVALEEIIKNNKKV